VKSVNLSLFLYNLAWSLIITLSLPLTLFPKGQRLIERLCLRLPDTPPKKQSIWIHACSVGEVISALPVVWSLKRQYPLRDIIFTVTTRQGMKIARDELEGKVDFLLPLPLDFWWSIRRITGFIRPSILVLVESDIWPGLISHLKSRGVKTLLINGRVSPRTFRSYRRFRPLSNKVLGLVNLWLMQSDLDRDRLLEIGLLPEKVKTVGNIKFDRTWLPMDEKERNHWLRLLNINPEDRVWVAGSTHEGEDEIVLETFGRLVVHFPELRLIIAPRRPERAEEIHGLCSIKGLKDIRRTDLPGDSDHYKVLILNTIGELGRLYGLAEISFVGGSMVPIGGHNLLEPASFGCPVLFGPHTHNFVLMSELLIEAGGGKKVEDAEDLFETMKGLLSETDRSGMMGKQAKEFVEMNRGALERVMEHIGGFLEAD